MILIKMAIYKESREKSTINLIFKTILLLENFIFCKISSKSVWILLLLLINPNMVKLQMINKF